MFVATLLLLASTQVSVGELKSFRNDVVHQPTAALAKYPELAKRIVDDGSEGAFIIHRYALVAAIKTHNREVATHIAHTISSPLYDTVSHNHVANALISIGAMYRVGHQYDQALHHYHCARKYITDNDTLNKLLINSAIAYRMLGLLKETHATLNLLDEQSLSIQVKAAQAVVYGNLLLDEGRYQEALQSFQQAVVFYKKQDDYHSVSKLIANILITTLLMNDFVNYRRYYDVLVNLLANKEDDELSSYMSLIELTRQYKVGELSAERYLIAVKPLLSHLSADAEVELKLIEKIAPTGFSSTSHTKHAFWPENLGEKWCGKFTP